MIIDWTALSQYPGVSNFYSGGYIYSYPIYGQAAAATWTDYGSAFLYTEANWGSSLNTYFEAYYKATSGTYSARLYDITGAFGVTDSQIDTSSATYSRERSTAISLTDGHEYIAQFGGFGAGDPSGAKLIFTVN